MTLRSVYISGDVPLELVRAAVAEWAAPGSVTFEVESAPEYQGYTTAVDFFAETEDSVAELLNFLRTRFPTSTIDSEARIDAQTSAYSG